MTANKAPKNAARRNAKPEPAIIPEQPQPRGPEQFDPQNPAHCAATLLKLKPVLQLKGDVAANDYEILNHCINLLANHFGAKG